MAHGSDTEELMRRIANIQNDWLDISYLQITSIPPLPSTLKMLFCDNTMITSLPELPPSLETLCCANTQITSLPDLPTSLKELWCQHTSLTSLPTLPFRLIHLWCQNTHITTLPELPSGLRHLWFKNTKVSTLPELPSKLFSLECQNTLVFPKKQEDESIETFYARWKESQRTIERCREIKQELYEYAFRPERVERWLADGGWEFMDTVI